MEVLKKTTYSFNFQHSISYEPCLSQNRPKNYFLSTALIHINSHVTNKFVRVHLINLFQLFKNAIN